MKLPVVRVKYSDDQPRAPAGESDGGQFTSGGGGSGGGGSSSEPASKPRAPTPASHHTAISHAASVAKVVVTVKKTDIASFGNTHEYSVAGTLKNFDIFANVLAKNAPDGMSVAMSKSGKQFSMRGQREGGGYINHVFALKSSVVSAKR